MGYTWTDGELITATKLNNTGGGDYDFTITADWDDVNIEYENLALDSGTYSDLVTKLQNSEIISGLLVCDYDGGAYLSALTFFLDLSSEDMVTVGFGGQEPGTQQFRAVTLIINSDGSVNLD